MAALQLLGVFIILIFHTISVQSISFEKLVLQENRKEEVRRISTPPKRWITQPVDNFDPTDTRVWKERYYEKLAFWKSGGPIIIYLWNGNTRFGQMLMENALLTNFAAEVKGAMFLFEFRFRGKSLISKKWRRYDLQQYLNSQQILADLKNFITYLKMMKKFKQSKVVLFGSRYAGNIATWMRAVYPDVADAAVATNTALLAKVFHDTYYKNIAETILKLNPSCYVDIAQNFQRYREMLKTPEGLKQLIKEEHMCNDIYDGNFNDNIQSFYEQKMDQYTSLFEKFPEFTIKTYCNETFNTTKNLPDSWCHGYNFENDVNALKNRFSHLLPSIYQRCNELGQFETSSENEAPFYARIPEYQCIYFCSYLFGSEFTLERLQENVKKTNALYGGLTPNVTKVFFLQGDLDPKRDLGPLSDLNDEAPVRVIEYAYDDAGLDGLGGYSDLIKKTLKKWIGM